jgi:hypothetical protein
MHFISFEEPRRGITAVIVIISLLPVAVGAAHLPPSPGGNSGKKDEAAVLDLGYKPMPPVSIDHATGPQPPGEPGKVQKLRA